MLQFERSELCSKVSDTGLVKGRVLGVLIVPAGNGDVWLKSFKMKEVSFIVKSALLDW